MINWDKPIETVDGRKARVIETNASNSEIWHIVYADSDPDSCGSKHDVFIVNNEGYRCDDRAIYSKRQEQFIRNARVKRAFTTLQEREPDPVEDAERAAHFETWKAKQR